MTDSVCWMALRRRIGLRRRTGFQAIYTEGKPCRSQKNLNGNRDLYCFAGELIRSSMVVTSARRDVDINLHAPNTTQKELNMIKGDHLVSSRLGYTHHGLYIGNGKVIHYSGFSELLNKGAIEITTIEDFEQGNSSSVKNHLISIYDADERVERAYSKLGEDSYNLLFNNCEHFVNWCFNGFKTSSQVNNAVAATATIANEYATRKGVETAASLIAQHATRTTATRTVEAALTSTVAKSVFSTTASTAAGVTAASAVTGTTAAGVVSAFAVGSVASVAAPVAIAVGVGAGVGFLAKKAFDWLLD